MKQHGTIAINSKIERKVYASSADMYVDIKGESFFSGRAALKKAREVRDLVAALAEVGIGESRIQVLGMRADVSTGILSKSSSVIYRLLLEVPSLEMLTDAFGVVTSRKNATLTKIEWQYDGLEQLHDQMLKEALQRAQQQAALICRELRHRNLGIHKLKEKLKDDQEKQETGYPDDWYMLGTGRRRSRVGKEDMGLEISHAKTVSLDVRVEYRVQPEPAAEPPAATGG